MLHREAVNGRSEPFAGADRSRRRYPLLPRIPQQRLALPERLHGHFDRDHRGAAEVGVAGELILAAEHVDEIAFEVTARLDQEVDFFVTVVLGFERFLGVAAPTQRERFTEGLVRLGALKADLHLLTVSWIAIGHLVGVKW